MKALLHTFLKYAKVFVFLTALLIVYSAIIMFVPRRDIVVKFVRIRYKRIMEFLKKFIFLIFDFLTSKEKAYARRCLMNSCFLNIKRKVKFIGDWIHFIFAAAFLLLLCLLPYRFRANLPI